MLLHTGVVPARQDSLRRSILGGGPGMATGTLLGNTAVMCKANCRAL